MTEDSCQLYLITPPQFEPSAFADRFQRACDGGDVACLQLRLKDVDDSAVLQAGEALLPLCEEREIPLIINDRPDLARTLGADGVHLGQEDGDLKEARALLGEGAVIGVSCHDSLDLAFEAGDAGADYVAFGAFFPTGTKTPKGHPKPELLQWWSEHTILPSVAIGGITPENCAPLVRAGADFLAVISAVWDHPDGPKAAVKAFHEAIANAL